MDHFAFMRHFLASTFMSNHCFPSFLSQYSDDTAWTAVVIYGATSDIAKFVMISSPVLHSFKLKAEILLVFLGDILVNNTCLQMKAALYRGIGVSIKILITSHKCAPAPVKVTFVELRGCGEFDLNKPHS